MRKSKTALCLFLIMLVFSLAGCGASPKSVTLVGYDGEENISASVKNKALFTETKGIKELKKISRSDMTVLYFNEETCAVSVYDYGAKKLWSALPEKYTDGKPSVLSVDILVGTKQYTLSSQTDSVEKGLASYEIKDDSVNVNYGFDFSLSDGTTVRFTVPVFFAATDGVMTASIDCAGIDRSGLDGAVTIKTLHLLEYFGASTQAADGDYILVPDECGAVIDISEKADKFEKISVPVYGADYASGEEDSATCARVAAFGMKSEDSAFCALVENGEAIAAINASKALKNSSYNAVGASFDITKTYRDGEAVYAQEESYDGEIRITYRILSGDNANYVGMAAACREGLIRNGTLGMSESDSSEGTLPFVLSVIGAAQNENRKKQVFTTFEQAEEMLTFFRSKGISNMVLRMRGIFEGETAQTDIGSLKIAGSLGSNKALSYLKDFTDSQNIRFFADVNLLTCRKKDAKDGALSIDGKAVTKEFQDVTGSSVRCVSERGFVSLSQSEEDTNTLLNFLRQSPLDGICLADAGKYLVSDYNGKAYISRQKAKSDVFSRCASISASKEIMTDSANIYTVKYASYAVNLPTSSALAKRDGISSVPFLQAVLHGMVSYSSTPINQSANPDTALLKAAEYGCIPSFEVYYADSGSEEEADTLNYINCAGFAQSVYERLSNTFSDLSGEKITAHYLVKKGVYCTQYSGDINVYVNYNNKDVTVNGVTVEARSFLRVG